MTVLMERILFVLIVCWLSTYGKDYDKGRSWERMRFDDGV